MNNYITYIQDGTANNISSLQTSLLTGYILSEDEQKYIETLNDSTASHISSLLLTASIKAGSSLYTQSALNRLYVRQDSSSYHESDKEDFIDYLKNTLVGNEIVKLEF